MVQYDNDNNSPRKSQHNISQMLTGPGSKKASGITTNTLYLQRNRKSKAPIFETAVFQRSKSLDLNDEFNQYNNIHYDIDSCKKTSIDEEGIYNYAFQL